MSAIPKPWHNPQRRAAAQASVATVPDISAVESPPAVRAVNGANIKADSRDAGTRPIHITFFGDWYASTLTTEIMAIWDLRDRIFVQTANTKDKLPWLKLATFGDKPSEPDENGKGGGCLRHDGNVISISGIELDYDGEVMPFEEAVARIKKARLCALLYTSPSHTVAAPRWRILLPTSRDLPPDQREKYVARIHGLFGGIFSFETFTLSQSYYYGSVNRSPAHRAEYFDGGYVDLRDDLDAGAICLDKSGKGDGPRTLTDAAGIRADVPITSLDDDRLKPLWPAVKYMIENAKPPNGAPAKHKGGSGHCFVIGALIRAGLNNAQIKDVYRLGKIQRGPTGHGRGFDGYVERVIAYCRPAPQEAAKPTTPVDLWGKFESPPLPTGLLPLVIEQYAIAQAAMMGCDAGGLAMAALTVCAAVISDRIELQMKRHDPYWKEAARIWVALVGSPSTKKSPIMRQAARELIRLDMALHRDYMQAMAQYEALPAEEKKMTRPPRQKRLRIEDTTIEAAQVVMMDSPDGVLCLQDELSGWFGAMDKYGSPRGAAKDRGFWMQSFNGGSYAVNRIIRGAGIIDNVSVSMLGGIQPEPMRKLVADSHDDGLIQRLFPIVLKSATMGKDEPQLDVVGACDDLIDRLHNLEPPTNRGSGNVAGFLPKVLRFDNAAQEFRGRLEQKHINLQACEAINKKLAAHIGKYDGLFGRLCVVWHCIENVNLPDLPDLITLSTARRVARFLHEYLLPHAIAFYTEILGLSDEHERLTAVAGYILARKLERVTNRVVAHGDRTMRKLTKRDIDNMFEQLDALGWVDRTPAPRPSDPPHWIVNPEVHKRFGARGESEAKRRAAAREAILEAIGASRANGDTDE
jgi:hypothetical protein